MVSTYALTFTDKRGNSRFEKFNSEAKARRLVIALHSKGFKDADYYKLSNSAKQEKQRHDLRKGIPVQFNLL